MLTKVFLNATWGHKEGDPWKKWDQRPSIVQRACWHSYWGLVLGASWLVSFVPVWVLLYACWHWYWGLVLVPLAVLQAASTEHTCELGCVPSLLPSHQRCWWLSVPGFSWLAPGPCNLCLCNAHGALCMLMSFWLSFKNSNHIGLRVTLI